MSKLKDFGEHAAPTDAIAAILATYAFSVGVFRELLQNSDDARATKQVRVLCNLNSIHLLTRTAGIHLGHAEPHAR